MAYAMKHPGAAAAPSGLDVLAGIWLLISPFVLAFHAGTAAVANNVVLGIVIGVLALIRFFGPSRNVGLSWVNFVLGIWVLISPWVLGFSSYTTALTNNVCMGIVVIILSLWSAAATSSDEHVGRDEIGRGI
jgi:hypothetical protein